MVRDASKIFKRLEVIADSEATEHYLFQMDTEQDRSISILRSLSSLTAHSLPLSEFAPRCLETLQNYLGFSRAAFIVEEGRTFRLGEASPEEEAGVCENGELTVSRDRTQPEVAVEEKRAGAPAIHYEGFVGSSRPIQAIYQIVEQVAPTNACVLIRGDSGTGKELIARIIVKRSPRANEPFVAFNCAAITESLVEAELFGIEKGVATGGTERRGKFEAAHRGTLFLDEVGDMSPIVQTKLLRVLQEHQVERVGGRKLIEVDTRIIAATNRDLEADVKSGRFRNDLYYRLNVISITLPPLRERRDDIPPLVNFFIEKYNEEFQRRIRGVGADVLDIFMQHTWPGNVRELGNDIERAVILCRGDLIQVEDLPAPIQQLRRLPPIDPSAVKNVTDLRELRRQTQEDATVMVEKNLIEAVLKETNWNAAQTARKLGISRSHFYRLLDKYGFKREP